MTDKTIQLIEIYKIVISHWNSMNKMQYVTLSHMMEYVYI